MCSEYSVSYLSISSLTAAVRSSPMNDEIIARTPAKRWGKSDEIIGATVFLASRGSDFITGATLPVDGGYSVY
jgi:2-deoxy-D-gluconate 3-dehydrogenase